MKVCAEFMAFLQWARKDSDVEKMLAGEIKATIPKRPDQRYAMLSAIVHNMRQHENPEELLNGFFDIVPSSLTTGQLIHHDITLVMDSEGKDDFLIALMEHPQHIDLENRIIL